MLDAEQSMGRGSAVLKMIRTTKVLEKQTILMIDKQAV